MIVKNSLLIILINVIVQFLTSIFRFISLHFNLLNHLGWNATNNSIRLYVLSHYGTGSNNGTIA